MAKYYIVGTDFFKTEVTLKKNVAIHVVQVTAEIGKTRVITAQMQAGNIEDKCSNNMHAEQRVSPSTQPFKCVLDILPMA